MHNRIQPGDVVRHFKGNKYEILCFAKDSETQEEMVVYRALYGEGGTWVRPKEMFLSKVDREKYPQAAQEYRFEKVTEESHG
ncbi:MAG: DUF1653 domain-containing protein [Clostridia bacterium]|nr:DUF1653 domain-containing protein [Clostridia bacterium]